jgi:hypothetical protein
LPEEQFNSITELLTIWEEEGLEVIIVSGRYNLPTELQNLIKELKDTRNNLLEKISNLWSEDPKSPMFDEAIDLYYNDED